MLVALDLQERQAVAPRRRGEGEQREPDAAKIIQMLQVT